MKLQQTKSGTLLVAIPKDLAKLMQLTKGSEVVVAPGKSGYLEIRKV